MAPCECIYMHIYTKVSICSYLG